jgi:hypothetical protein
MCHTYLSNARLFFLLLVIDRDLAKHTRDARCPSCGDVLHIANYPRKPRCVEGLKLGVEFSWRFSFCCGREGCRRRATPPSVRFLGRKVYLSVFVMLITALRQGATPRGAKALKAEFGVDRRTLKRWQAWWREVFPRGEFWSQARRQLFPNVPDESALPRSLLECFGVAGRGSIQALSRCLRFICPVSASLALAEHARLWPS